MNLEARGESIEDMLMYLFKGYMAAGDSKFVKYIEDIQEQFYDERVSCDYKEVMKLALNKYTNKKRDNSWGVSLQEQQQIVALTTQVE